MKTRAGFVMLAALWILVAVAGISTAIAQRLHQQRLQSLALIEDAAARDAAVAGIALVEAELSSLIARAEAATDTALIRDPWHGAGELFADERIQIGDAAVRITLRSTGTLLNVNDTDAGAFDRFLQTLGADSSSARRISAEIVDWKDTDDDPVQGGAEREAYPGPVRPSNRSILDLEELQHVRSFTPEIYRRALPYLTVAGGSRVHLGEAPAPVLATLPGVSPRIAEEIATIRSHTGSVDWSELISRLPTDMRAILERDVPRLAGRTTTVTHEVLVIAEGVTVSGRRIVIEAIMVRSEGRARITSWRIR